MGFAILRTQKLKSGAAVRRSLTHAFRAQTTPNADPKRTPDNTHIGAATVAEALDGFNARLATQDKVRKNAVLAVEYLMTASPEDMRGKTREQQDAYFGDALDWLKAKHGAENVVYAGIHRDESTPHMYAYVVPLDARGKLNCRAFLGGAGALREMQTDFAQTVGARHGLQRGIEGSRAKHTRIQQYYARANADFEPLPPVRPKPAPLRPEPQKPGLFASKVERQAYELDHAAWQKEQTAHQKQSHLWRKEALAQASVAVDVARRHETQARETGALRREVEQLRESGGHYVRKSAELEAELTHARGVAALFSPAEIAARQAAQAKEAQERAKKAAEAKRRDEVGKEYRKRVEALQRLSDRSAGAAHTFARHGLRAMRDAEQDADRVNWKQVELDALRESMLEHGQPVDEAVEAITKHSPRCADPANRQQFEESVNNVKPQLERAQAYAMAEQEKQPKAAQSRGPRMR